MINRRSLLQLSIAAAAAPVFPRAFANSGQPGRWKSRAAMPVALQEIYPAICGEKIHVAGGFTPVGEGRVQPSDAHLQYSIAEDHWKTRAALPEARHHPALAASGERIYALGGFRKVEVGDWSMCDQSWVYFPGEDRWEILQSSPEPHAEAVSLAASGMIHVIGGRTPKGENNAGWMDHADSKRHLVYDTASGKWSTLAPPAYARNSAAGALIDDKLFVVGGRSVKGGNMAQLEIYDLKEDRWREASPMPQAQGGLAAAELGGHLIALGGEYFGADGHGVYSEVWRYKPELDRWSSLPPMLTPRHGLGAVSDGAVLYAIGGATEVGPRGTSNSVESYSLNEQE